jgi:hypothetical protein
VGIGKHTALYSRVLVELLTLLALVNLWEFQEYQDKADDEGKDTQAKERAWHQFWCRHLACQNNTGDKDWRNGSGYLIQRL